MIKPVSGMVLGLIFIQAVHAQPSFFGVGELPGGLVGSGIFGLSGDGSTAVGGSATAPGLSGAFHWTASAGIQALPYPSGGSGVIQAFAANQTGNVVVGHSSLQSGAQIPVMWKNGGTAIDLGSLGGFSGQAHSVNSSGTAAVGFSFGPNGREAFRWTEAGGMVGLGDLAGGAFDSWAFDISDDGNTVVGTAQGANGSRSFLWTQLTGMQAISAFANEIDGAATAINGAGNVVVGGSCSAETTCDAYRWEDGVAVLLGDLAGGVHWSVARGVSDDGATIVGDATTSSAFGPDTAFYWTEQLGMVDLKEHLLSLGILGVEGWTLESAQGISDDGLTIAGMGINPQGFNEGWIAHIPAPSSCVVLVIGGVIASRRRR
ncbi:MAG: PEP-CTERM sorting domain-containing protein [Phycisphaeraceae bacterium]|nr:hypothetical protein [Phycisphaerales bacterium]MCB9859989.1 PEP-CTERM sorting domain-containing protein [Phycisphaeraceae bacterium]